jgi:hypothetical protein
VTHTGPRPPSRCPVAPSVPLRSTRTRQTHKVKGFEGSWMPGCAPSVCICSTAGSIAVGCISDCMTPAAAGLKAGCGALQMRVCVGGLCLAGLLFPVNVCGLDYGCSHAPDRSAASFPAALMLWLTSEHASQKAAWQSSPTTFRGPAPRFASQTGASRAAKAPPTRNDTRADPTLPSNRPCL